MNETAKKSTGKDSTGTEPAADREIVSVRLIDAPRERVFEAWTDPKQIQQWWGPKGFTNTFHEFDARPGGRWRFVMHGPDGADYKNEIVFVEVDPPKRLVLDHTSGHKFRIVATFEAEGEKTRLTFRQTFETAAELGKIRHIVAPGNEQNLDRLEAVLAGMLGREKDKRAPGPDTHDREIVLSRLLDVPRERVFRAWTNPKELEV